MRGDGGHPAQDLDELVPAVRKRQGDRFGGRLMAGVRSMDRSRGMGSICRSLDPVCLIARGVAVMNGSVFRFEAFGFPVRVTGMALLLLVFLSAQAAGPGMGTRPSPAPRSSRSWSSSPSSFMSSGMPSWAAGWLQLEIVLHGFGGLCSYRRRPSPSQGVLSSAAGPAAGLALGALSFGGLSILPADAPPALGVLLGDLAWINLVWSLFNLLPVFPLDGGAILASALQMRLKPHLAWKITSVVSLGCAAIVAVWGLSRGAYFIVAIMALTALENLRRGGRLTG